MNKFNISIAKRIDELRKVKGFSWEKLAYSSGISKGGMSEIKNALVEPKLSTLCRISVALEMPIMEFFNFKIDISDLD